MESMLHSVILEVLAKSRSLNMPLCDWYGSQPLFKAMGGQRGALGQVFDNVLTRLLSTLAPNKSEKYSCLRKLFSDCQPRGRSKALGCSPRVLQVRSGGSLCRCNGPADMQREKSLVHAKQHTSVLISWPGTSHSGRQAFGSAVCLPSVGKENEPQVKKKSLVRVLLCLELLCQPETKSSQP